MFSLIGSILGEDCWNWSCLQVHLDTPASHSSSHSRVQCAVHTWKGGLVWMFLSWRAVWWCVWRAAARHDVIFMAAFQWRGCTLSSRTRLNDFTAFNSHLWVYRNTNALPQRATFKASSEAAHSFGRQNRWRLHRHAQKHTQQHTQTMFCHNPVQVTAGWTANDLKILPFPLSLQQETSVVTFGVRWPSRLCLF